MTADDAPYLNPTAEEAATMRQHVNHWDQRDPWQQSVCIALRRGHATIDGIAEYLEVTPDQVWHAVRPLLGQGLHYDDSLGKLFFR